MMQEILKMYVTLIPPIIAGIINMVWCKSNKLNILKKPMDCNKNFIDGKRILGDNKTWKGFLGYIIFNIICTIMWGIICDITKLNKLNYFYYNYPNNIAYNALIGFLLGLGYALFELPNSFLKRRIGIKPGKTSKGISKILFIFLDQADSIFGCCLVVSFFYRMTIEFYLLYVLIGAITHIAFNILLYFLKLRKNMF